MWYVYLFICLQMACHALVLYNCKYDDEKRLQQKLINVKTFSHVETTYIMIFIFQSYQITCVLLSVDLMMLFFYFRFVLLAFTLMIFSIITRWMKRHYECTSFFQWQSKKSGFRLHKTSISNHSLKMNLFSVKFLYEKKIKSMKIIISISSDYLMLFLFLMNIIYGSFCNLLVVINDENKKIESYFSFFLLVIFIIKFVLLQKKNCFFLYWRQKCLSYHIIRKCNFFPFCQVFIYSS